MSRMTTKLKEVIERVQNWPQERQEDAAKVLLEMEAQDASSYQLLGRAACRIAPPPRRNESTDVDVGGIRQKIALLRHMKIVIRQKADDDLDGIFAWIEKDNPRAAVEVIRRIREKIGLLLTEGVAHMGRPGRDEGTRELI